MHCAENKGHACKFAISSGKRLHILGKCLSFLPLGLAPVTDVFGNRPYNLGRFGRNGLPRVGTVQVGAEMREPSQLPDSPFSANLTRSEVSI
jgi:hypothetical protein